MERWFSEVKTSAGDPGKGLFMLDEAHISSSTGPLDLFKSTSILSAYPLPPLSPSFRQPCSPAWRLGLSSLASRPVTTPGLVRTSDLQFGVACWCCFPAIPGGNFGGDDSMSNTEKCLSETDVLSS